MRRRDPRETLPQRLVVESVPGRVRGQRTQHRPVDVAGVESVDRPTPVDGGVAAGHVDGFVQRERQDRHAGERVVAVPLGGPVVVAVALAQQERPPAGGLVQFAPPQRGAARVGAGEVEVDVDDALLWVGSDGQRARSRDGKVERSERGAGLRA